MSTQRAGKRRNIPRSQDKVSQAIRGMAKDAAALPISSALQATLDRMLVEDDNADEAAPPARKRVSK